jgi:hypothetical protein
MTNIEFEARMTNLENEVAALKRQIEQSSPVSTAWWEKIAGTFKDDEAHEEAMRLGREYRLAHKIAPVDDEK